MSIYNDPPHKKKKKWDLFSIFFFLSRLIMACRFHFLNKKNLDFFGDDGDAIALQYNDRIQIRSILCVFSTDEPCKDRLILTAKKTDKTN